MKYIGQWDRRIISLNRTICIGFALFALSGLSAFEDIFDNMAFFLIQQILIIFFLFKRKRLVILRIVFDYNI